MKLEKQIFSLLCKLLSKQAISNTITDYSSKWTQHHWKCECLGCCSPPAFSLGYCLNAIYLWIYWFIFWHFILLNCLWKFHSVKVDYHLSTIQSVHVRIGTGRFVYILHAMFILSSPVSLFGGCMWRQKPCNMFKWLILF